MTESESSKVRIREASEFEPDGSITLIIALELHIAFSLWKPIKRWTIDDIESNPEDVSYARTCAEELRDNINHNDSI